MKKLNKVEDFWTTLMVYLSPLTMVIGVGIMVFEHVCIGIVTIFWGATTFFAYNKLAETFNLYKGERNQTTEVRRE